MADLFLLSRVQMRRIERYFPLSHGIARVDDRRIVSAIVFVIRNGLRWRDAPPEYGPHKTIYNRFIRWSRLGVFNKIFAELAGRGADERLQGRGADAARPAQSQAASRRQGLRRRLVPRDTECRSYGAKPGTSEYIQCRVTKNQQHEAAMAAVLAGGAASVPTTCQSFGNTTSCF
jgi:putative transposase